MTQPITFTVAWCVFSECVKDRHPEWQLLLCSLHDSLCTDRAGCSAAGDFPPKILAREDHKAERHPSSEVVRDPWALELSADNRELMC